jgi:hypothetical protein
MAKKSGISRLTRGTTGEVVGRCSTADLTADDLIGLGVTSIGHRRKLLAAIAMLRDGPPISSTPIPSTMR